VEICQGLALHSSYPLVLKNDEDEEEGEKSGEEPEED
jgi:hypothetical protein